MFLLGLGHKAQHGKDTFANAVVAARGQQMKIQLASFADPLRAEVSAGAREVWSIRRPGEEFQPQTALKYLCDMVKVPFIENAPIEQDYPWGKQRPLLQWWGTDYRRAQNPYYWVDQASEIIKSAAEANTDALIFRDMRFENEYGLVGDLYGWRQKITRLGWKSDVPQHISEMALDGFDFDGQLAVRDGELPLLRRLSVTTFDCLLAA